MLNFLRKWYGDQTEPSTPPPPPVAEVASLPKPSSPAAEAEVEVAPPPTDDADLFTPLANCANLEALFELIPLILHVEPDAFARPNFRGTLAQAARVVREREGEWGSQAGVGEDSSSAGEDLEGGKEGEAEKMWKWRTWRGFGWKWWRTWALRLLVGDMVISSPSPLLRLPPELRNHIYELALTQEAPISAVESWESTLDPPPLNVNITNPYPLALTQTCKQINSECDRFFFTQNAFFFPAEHILHFLCKDSPERLSQPLCTFAATIGAENAAMVQDVTIDLGRLKRSRFPTRRMNEIMTGVLSYLGECAEHWPHWRLKAKFGMVEDDPVTYRWVTCEVQLNRVKQSLEEEARRLEEAFELRPESFYRMNGAVAALRKWADGVGDEGRADSGDEMLDQSRRWWQQAKNPFRR